VERHHRTFKAWLAEQPPFATVTELQTLCDRYQDCYNRSRRHSAVNMPPLQAWRQAAAFGGPDQLPVQTDADVRVLKVSSRGLIALRPIWVTVGKRYAGQSVTALLDSDHLTVYQADGKPIGHRRIDYTQPYRNNLLPAA
jgi:putative transposase